MMVMLSARAGPVGEWVSAWVGGLEGGRAGELVGGSRWVGRWVCGGCWVALGHGGYFRRRLWQWVGVETPSPSSMHRGIDPELSSMRALVAEHATTPCPQVCASTSRPNAPADSESQRHSPGSPRLLCSSRPVLGASQGGHLRISAPSPQPHAPSTDPPRSVEATMASLPCHNKPRKDPLRVCGGMPTSTNRGGIG